ncbi:hypothetical protein AX14_011933 [Amanita brunnescens Koide BX004]|nr:hypothetical protein AX14_011933 [Amanita brunnescens Koide BX004]
MVGYGAGITLLVMTYKLELFAEVELFRWEVIFAFATSTFNDFVLAVGICHLLLLSATTIGETKSMLWIIMRYVLISGTLTSMCSLAGLIIFCVMPNNLIFLGVTFVVTKLYINSYLAMLNARKSIRNRGSIKAVQVSDLEMRLSTISWSQGMHDSRETVAETRNKNQEQGPPGGENRNTDLMSVPAEDNEPMSTMSPVVGDDAC